MARPQSWGKCLAVRTIWEIVKNSDGGPVAKVDFVWEIGEVVLRE